MSQQATSRPSPARRRENQTLLQVFKSPRVPEHCIHATLVILRCISSQYSHTNALLLSDLPSSVRRVPFHSLNSGSFCTAVGRHILLASCAPRKVFHCWKYLVNSSLQREKYYLVPHVVYYTACSVCQVSLLWVFYWTEVPRLCWAGMLAPTVQCRPHSLSPSSVRVMLGWIQWHPPCTLHPSHVPSSTSSQQ